MSYTSTSMLDIASARKIDSTWRPRISKMQALAMTRGAVKIEFSDDEYLELGTYVQTGDISCLTADTKKKVDQIIVRAKEDLNESQARRIWPRKVAAHLIATA